MAKRKKNGRVKRGFRFRSAPAQPADWGTCPHCGTQVQFDSARGRFLEHAMPKSMMSCPGPRRFNAPRRNGGGGLIDPERLFRDRSPEGVEDPSIVRPSKSVRTVSGGLPTLGRRR